MGVGHQLEDRPVFITGGTGFIGSHLTERMVEHGADVVVFVEPGGPGELQNLASVTDHVTVYRGDLRDQHSVRRALRHFEDRVGMVLLHLAAQAHVGASWHRPHETVSTNVTGTLNLLESIVDLDLDVAKILTAGSSEEYGNPRTTLSIEERRQNGGKTKLDETSTVNPTSIYATTKLAADYLTMNYHDAYGLPCVVTRMFNNYGPRQSPRYITGTVISQALEREYVELGNLDSRRDMSYVTDGVRGLVKAALEGSTGERYVIGSGQAVTMREWTSLILDTGQQAGYWDDIEVVQCQERYRPGDSEVDALVADYEKLESLTGWEPAISYRNGLEQTIEWFADNRPVWRDRVDWGDNYSHPHVSNE